MILYSCGGWVDILKIIELDKTSFDYCRNLFLTLLVERQITIELVYKFVIERSFDLILENLVLTYYLLYVL